MGFSFNVPMMDGSTYKLSKLLAAGKANTKTAKSDKNLDTMTVSLSMAPAHTSGFNLCASASKPCIDGCIFTSGYAMINPRTILPARIAKARFLRLYKDEFFNRLVLELKNAERKANRLNKMLCVRLNVFSDVMWEKEFPELFKLFTNVCFYDYTKHYSRMLKYLREELPGNYHLTFSWSGENALRSLDVLAKGGNVAVPFHVKYLGDKRKPLPRKFLGYNVVDGDIDDLRFLDPWTPHVIGLRVKGKAKKDVSSDFVISLSDSRVEI